MMTYLPYVDML